MNKFNPLSPNTRLWREQMRGDSCRILRIHTAFTVQGAASQIDRRNTRKSHNLLAARFQRHLWSEISSFLAWKNELWTPLKLRIVSFLYQRTRNRNKKNCVTHFNVLHIQDSNIMYVQVCVARDIRVCQLKLNLKGNSTLKQSVPLALWCKAKDIFSSGVVSQESLACKTKDLVCTIYKRSIRKDCIISTTRKQKQKLHNLNLMHCSSKGFQ